MDILVITLDSVGQARICTVGPVWRICRRGTRDTFFVTLDGVGQAIGGKDSTWTMNDMLVQP